MTEPTVTPATGSEVEYPTPCELVVPLAAEVEAARTALDAALTVEETKARALVLDDVRGQQILALIAPT